MAKVLSRTRPAVKTTTLWILLGIGLVWFVISFGLWFRLVYTSPENVFQTMLAQNFMTPGYTRYIASEGNGVLQTETAQIQFGQKNIAATHISLKNGQAEQRAEVISTPTKDFIRYTSFTTVGPDGKTKKNVGSKAMGVWAIADKPGELNQSFTKQTLLATYFPMGLVPAAERADLLHFISKNTVYSPNYKTVKKESMNGRNVYTYEVSVQLQTFVPMLQDFAEATGQAAAVAGLNANDYAGSAPVKLDVSVDVLSQRIVRVAYNNDGAVFEAYGGYGVQNWQVGEPKKHVSTLQLQELLSQ